MADEQTTVSAEEVATMLRRAGLELNPEDFAALIDALPHVEAKARLVRDRISRGDEPASTYSVEQVD
jgi:hypothetical protein